MKRYGKVAAVDGVSFSADPGSVLAVLGPNGAGKTTTVRIMTTLTTPTPELRRWRASTWLRRRTRR